MTRKRRDEERSSARAPPKIGKKIRPVDPQSDAKAPR
jgi:hypothetical protein